MKVDIKDMNGMLAFDYCRARLSEGSSKEEKLEVYRGDTLAYTVSSLEWGALCKLRESSKRGFYTERYRPFESV